MAYWVVQIDLRRGALAEHCLQKISGYEIYAPRVRERARIMPLFLNYLFVRESERGWWAARWSPGIVKLVMSGDMPALLSDQIVSDLKAREDRHGLVRLPKPSHRLNGSAAQFQPGDAIRIRTGPLSGLSGLVSTMRPHQRVEVLLKMLGAPQRVELPVAVVGFA